jgi:hypothetical protein
MDKKKIRNYSGAIVNSGDFLIQNGADYVLSQIFSSEVITHVNRHDHVDQSFTDENINFLFGGPTWSSDVFDNELRNLASLKIIPMGVGMNAALNYKRSDPSLFTGSTLRKLKDHPLTVRDFDTLDFLHNLGLKKAILGGCPAFIKKYDASIKTNPRRVYISDPSWWWNYKKVYLLIKKLKKFDRRLDITFVWHRGIFTKFNSLKLNTFRWAFDNLLKSMGVSTIDGAFSDEMFSEYNKGMHIGFRVHAHVYCRSNNIPSFLFSEDHRSQAMLKVFNEKYTSVEGDYKIGKIFKYLESQSCYSSLKCELFEATSDSLLKIYEM